MQLTHIRIREPLGGQRLAWTRGLSFAVPGEIAADRTLFRPTGSAGEMDILARPHPQLAPLASRLRLLAAFTEQPPASARLPLPYQAVPVGLRDLIAKGIGRFNRRRLETRPGFPLWPLDLSADLLSDLAGLHNPPFN